MNYDLDKLRELIPLYLYGRLSERERRQFEDALDKYPELKKEFREFLEIKKAYKGIQEEVTVPSDSLYQRILSEMKSEVKVSSAFTQKGYVEKLREFLRDLFGSPRLSWGIAAVQLAIIIILIVNLWGGEKLKTLTSRDIQEEGIKINVIFDKESQEKEIRLVLEKIKATIIGGPSHEGLYIIRVRDRQDINSVLEVLKKSGIVRFAEKAY